MADFAFRVTPLAYVAVVVKAPILAFIRVTFLVLVSVLQMIIHFHTLETAIVILTATDSQLFFGCLTCHMKTREIIRKREFTAATIMARVSGPPRPSLKVSSLAPQPLILLETVPWPSQERYHSSM